MVEHVTFEEVDRAYWDCRRHKARSKGALLYALDAEVNNLLLYEELNNLTYKIGKSRCFCVTRPKLREVFCSKFRDRIVHHLLYNKFNDLLEICMIPDAYACRVGRGTLFGVLSLLAKIERISEKYTKETWVLKCDVEGFFMSIDRELLFKRLEKFLRWKYKGDDLEWWLALWKLVVLHKPEENCYKTGNLSLFKKLPKNKSLFTSGGKGLPIGNLPSQVLANFFMAPFDLWIRQKLGNNGYGRYVDDFFLVHNDKSVLLGLINEIRTFLKDKLGIKLHPKKIYLLRVEKGIKFTGTYIKPGRRYTINRTINNIHRMIETADCIDLRFVNRLNSYFGFLIYNNTFAIRKKLWNKIKELHRRTKCPYTLYFIENRKFKLTKT